MSFLSFLPSILSILSTVIIALVAWGFRSTVSEVRSEIKKNTENIEKNSRLIEKVSSEYDDRIDKLATKQGVRMEKLETNFNDLKSDLPLLYVLREDFVRTMNNVESKIGGMDNKLDRLLEKIVKVKGGNTDG